MTEDAPLGRDDMLDLMDQYGDFTFIQSHDSRIVGWYVPAVEPPTPDAKPIISGSMTGPVAYRRRDGQTGLMPAEVREQMPEHRWASIPGQRGIWHEVPPLDAQGPAWHIGIHGMLRPRTTWGRFWWHIAHGRLMRYPWPDVLAFAWKHRK